MPVAIDWTYFFKRIRLAVPQRVVLSFLGFFAIVHAYSMRYCLDIALTQIVDTEKIAYDHQQKIINDRKLPEGLSLARKDSNIKSLGTKNNAQVKTKVSVHADKAAAEQPKKTYYWSSELQTIIISSFYMGYVLSHVPGALFADHYGGKWVLGVCIAGTAVLTMLTPLTIQIGGPIALIVLRVFLGVSEGPMFPALCSLLSKWVPARERGTLGVLALSGGQAAIFFVNFMSGLILQQFDWPLLFYFFGGCALIWFACFVFLCSSDPESNAFIEDSEKQYLADEIGSSISQIEGSTTPWKDIMTSAPMWALISATVQYDWTQLQMIAEMPKFIQDFNAASLSEGIETSITTSMPYMLNWIVSLTAGIVSDVLVNYNVLSITVTRKIMTAIAALGPNLFLGLASYFISAEHDDLFSLFSYAVGIMGTYYAGTKLTPLDMSPNYAAMLMAIANSLGSLTSLILPFVQNFSMKHTYFHQMRTLLWVACTAFITGDIQSFNNPVRHATKTE